MKQEQFIRIRVKLMEQLRQGAEWSDEEILERIDLLVSETARENRLTVKQREEIRRELFYSVRKLDILQELLDDDRADGKSHLCQRKNWRMWYSRLPENVTA